ncbi:MAG: ligand-gated channel [Alphaproteobacteria bacterium]|nr:MAG: ligand-gated channel [Alphaproteobacteria bacterium]
MTKTAHLGTTAIAILLAAPLSAPSLKAGATETASAFHGIEEVVVTARKRQESDQDIPVSLRAISAESIERYDVTDLESLTNLTPEFSVTRSAFGSGAQLTLRGIGSNPLALGTEQSVAVVVDGVYYGEGRVINEGFFDLESVEILKGPQSLFYGKNATAGVISINTANPTDELTARVTGGYEFKGEKLFTEAVISGPLSDTLGIRVGVRASKMYDGYFVNDADPVNYVTRDTPPGVAVADAVVSEHLAPPSVRKAPGEDEFLGRVTLRWEPNDRFAMTLKANYGESKVNPATWNYVVYACEGGFSTRTPDVPCTRDFVSHTNDFPAELAAQTRFARDGKLFNDYESGGVTATLEYDFDNLKVTSVSNYHENSNSFLADTDYQNSQAVNIWAAEKTKFHAGSSELRVLSTYASPVNFLVGGYYQNTKRTFGQSVMLLGSENSEAPDGYRYVTYAKESQTDGETLSAYGQLIWQVVPEVEATAGVRYIHETKDSSFIQPYANPQYPRYRVGEAITADQTFNNWSPEATLTWRPTDDLTLYGAYRTAYKSGGFANSSILTQTTPESFFTFDPESAEGFEVGLKSALFERQVRFDLGLYTYKFTDLQVTYLNSTSLSYNSINAGSARTEGVEASFQYAPKEIPEVVLFGSVNYNRARYKSFIAPCYAGQTIAQGCSLELSPGTPGQDLAGAPTAAAPDWTASLGANYERPIKDRFIFGGSIFARYSSGYFPSAFATPLGRQPEYVNIDASLRVSTEDSGWELAFIAKNLTNVFVATGVIDAPATGSGTGTAVGRTGDQVGQILLPRTFQLQLTWRM